MPNSALNKIRIMALFEKEWEMKMSTIAIVLGLLISVALTACAERKRVYTKELNLEKGFEFRPGNLPTGAPANHPCIRGSYIHIYDTDQGQYGQREVFLCCVPVDEILSDSFNCGSSAFPSLSIASILGGDSDYWKIRSCYLLHPTETEPTFIPVCIPAPVSADSLLPR